MDNRALRLREEELVWQDLDGEIVVLDMRASRYLSVTGSGALLWRRLQEGASLEDLVGALTEAYGIPDVQAQRDVRAFVDGLDERDLLRA